MPCILTSCCVRIVNNGTEKFNMLQQKNYNKSKNYFISRNACGFQRGINVDFFFFNII